MSVTIADMQVRVGKDVRLKVAYPNNPTCPETEYVAKISRVWPDQRMVDFHNGYATLRVSIDDIVSVDGGLQIGDTARTSFNL